MTPAGHPPAAAGEVAATPGKPTQRILSVVMSVFFAWGFCTVLVDTLVPKLKAMFALSYTEAMLSQFCFFIAFFVVSLPASWLLERLGYMRTMTAGLLVMAGASLLFAPAATLGLYPAFLGALFTLASGVVLLQVTANPLAAILGDPQRSHLRLTLAQAFNSLGTMLAPLFGSALILAGGIAVPDTASMSAAEISAFRSHEAELLQLPFGLIAGFLVALALLCGFLRRAPVPTATPARGGSYGRVLKLPRLSLGAVSIFLYVGAEVAIGSAMVNFLMQGSGMGAQRAGNLVAVYWGLAMVGRFIGAQLLRTLRAERLLMACALAAALLAGGSTLASGMLAAAMVLAIGLFNSVMFPNIFTLAIESLDEDAASGSGILCLAIVGGAVVPVIFGAVADHAGLTYAYLVPAACYLWIAGYGYLARVKFTGTAPR